MEVLQPQSIMPTTTMSCSAFTTGPNSMNMKRDKRLQDRNAKRAYKRMRARIEQLQAKSKWQQDYSYVATDAQAPYIQQQHPEFGFAGPFDSQPTCFRRQGSRDSMNDSGYEGSDTCPSSASSDFAYPCVIPTEGSTVFPDAQQHDSTSQVPAFLPHHDDMVTFGSAMNDWASQTLMHGSQSPSFVDFSSSAMPGFQLPPSAFHGMPPAFDSFPPQQEQQQQQRQDSPGTSAATLSHSLEQILECSRYKTFDGVARAYYTQKLDGAESSDAGAVAHEQRFSRNRGLPKLISDVFESSKSWSDWERGGFYDEMLNTTEHVLSSEGERARENLESEVASLNVETKPDPANIGKLQETIQTQMPNLWALMMGLSTAEGELWNPRRCSTVLASIVLMSCSGGMAKEQLLNLLGAML